MKSKAFSLHVIFIFWELTHSEDHDSLFCLKIAWVVAKIIYSFKTKLNQLLYLYTLRCGQQRGHKLMCSPLVIHTGLACLSRDNLWYFSPSVHKKQYNCFIIFPTLIRWRSRNIFFSPLKLSTWFLHYWNEENLHLFSLHAIFTNVFFLTQNTTIWCSELFDVLQYLVEISIAIVQNSRLVSQKLSIFSISRQADHANCRSKMVVPTRLIKNIHRILANFACFPL